ncbi:MAG TPA: VOC family protein [Roseiarcus sp.]|nr:VOC family protein [Roseiarcus sp.]
MIKSLSAISLLVPDYDEGLAFFNGSLGFAVEEDAPLGAEKRWIVVAPPGNAGAKIVLAVPSDERQRARIGDQTGGRVGYFLLTDDFQKDYAALRARGVKFLEAPRHEPYGTVAAFVDPWGGKWDLLQPIGVSGEEASSAP